MSEKTNTSQEESKLSPEELGELRKSTIKHYTEQIKVAESQLAYEQVIADLEEARLRKMTAIARQAQMFQAPPADVEKNGAKTPPVNTEGKPTRKLQDK